MSEATRRGRKPRAATPVVTPEAVAAAAPMSVASEVLMAAAERQDTEVLDLGIEIGRLEALDFIATIANTAAIPIFDNVKKSKAWRYLKNPQSCDGRNFESLDEFCQVRFGKSYRRLQELSAARSTLGQEAFEQAEKLGLRQVDYNAIKALPAPEQELVRCAVEDATSREEVLALLQQLAAQVAQKQIELTRRVTDLEANAVAKDQLLEKKQNQLTVLELQQHKKIVADTDWPDALVPLTDQIAAAGRQIAHALSALETCRIALFETGQQLAGDVQPKYEAAFSHVAEVFEEALGRGERGMERERAMFEKTLGNFRPE